jgi:hypothetical protein
MLQPKDIVTLLNSAWGEAVAPLPWNISKPTYDDEGVSKYFTGKSWHGHSASELRRLDFAPNIFTDEAFAYYLPAYLIGDIEEPQESDTNVERVLFGLTGARGSAVLSKLDAMQCLAIRAYIEFIQMREQGLYDDECSIILSKLRTHS